MHQIVRLERYLFSVVTKKLTPEQITKLNIDPTSLPKHVSVIMDGNGRWAQERSLPRTDGHLQGEEALFECVEAAIELNIPWLTAYGFSTENWKRPKTEIDFLFKIIRNYFSKEIESVISQGIRINIIGELKKLSDFNLNVESDSTQRIQEMHILVGHIICDIIESHYSI